MFWYLSHMYYICTSIMRGGAVVARWAHNPKVGGSNPSSATIEDSSSFLMGSFSFIPSELLINWDFARNKEFTLEVRYVLLYTSDAADDLTRVDLGGRRIIKKQTQR